MYIASYLDDSIVIFKIRPTYNNSLPTFLTVAEKSDIYNNYDNYNILIIICMSITNTVYARTICIDYRYSSLLSYLNGK